MLGHVGEGRGGEGRGGERARRGHTHTHTRCRERNSCACTRSKVACCTMLTGKAGLAIAAAMLAARLPQHKRNDARHLHGVGLCLLPKRRQACTRQIAFAQHAPKVHHFLAAVVRGWPTPIPTIATLLFGRPGPALSAVQDAQLGQLQAPMPPGSLSRVRHWAVSHPCNASGPVPAGARSVGCALPESRPFAPRRCSAAAGGVEL